MPLPQSFTVAPRRPQPAAAGWFARDEAIMGTAIRAELWAESPAAAQDALDAVMAEMHRIDAAMSPFKPESELSRVNREAPQRPVPIGAELFALLQHAAAFSRLSGGAFDLTYASVGHLYDYRRGVRPDDAALAKWRAGIGWQKVELDRRAGTVRFAHPLTRIDLGGFAKGHAVDNAARLLARRGIGHALVSAGGDSRVIGDRRGRPWSVAIRHPRRADAVVAVLPLEDCAVSTSGDYERGFDEAGVRHHHLIDPRTGRSPDAIHSVTIVAPDGLSSEALSKTVFVLGVAAGLRIVEAYPGADAVVIDHRGGLHRSRGLIPGGSAAPANRRSA
jgi:thiamine biosynthesis lipoprotein